MLWRRRVIVIVRCAQKRHYTLIHLIPITQYWGWTSSRRPLENMKAGPEGLKTLSRGAPDHFWPYLCMCQLCTNRNGSLLVPCASVKLLTSHPPRLCLGPPGRLPCHVMSQTRGHPKVVNCLGKNTTHNIFTIFSFFFPLCPNLSIKEKLLKYINVQWFVIHPFNSHVCLQAGVKGNLGRLLGIFEVSLEDN